MLTVGYKTIGIGCYELDGTYYCIQIFSTSEVNNSSLDGFSGTKDANVKVDVETNLIDDIRCYLLDYKTEFKSGIDKEIKLDFQFRLEGGRIYARPITSEYTVEIGDNTIFKLKDQKTLEAKKVGETTITFKTAGRTKTYTIVSKLPFDDVKEDSWYYNAIKYVFNNDIIKGYDMYTFAPSDNVTRGMLVTILHRMEGSTKATGASKFNDVQDSSKYYYEAVKWATDNKIVSGYNEKKFGPTDYITRQQLAVILNNYAKYKKKNTSQTSDLSEFKDVNKISSYALSAMKWAVGVNVISGNADKTLAPRGNATRAEVAAMIQKYCINVGR